MERPVSVLISRDDFYHQRGYWVVANSLKNAGMEVILGGIQTPREIARTALQEDVDVIGYRIMQGAPRILVPLLLERMRELGIEDKPIVVGGIVPAKEEELIRGLGVKDVFHPFTPLSVLVERVKALGAGYRAGAVAGGKSRPLQ
jgi:methylmalonyl-CoA mutase C-terminal domain/subunit